jgi:hypothetical protein
MTVLKFNRMKRIILHINILLILFILTSFVDERENYSVSNFYNINEATQNNNFVVTKYDQQGNTSYFHYNKIGQLSQIDYNENTKRIFSYNNEGQLITSELFSNTQLIDKETLSWNKDKIVKIDFNLVQNKLEESIKEEFILNSFGQIVKIKSFTKKNKSDWISSSNTIKYNWNFNQLESIESYSNKLNEIALLEKLDVFIDLENTQTNKSGKKKVIEITYSHDIQFTPTASKSFDISSLINNNTSSFYISFWDNGRRKEAIQYKLNTDTYPLQLEVQVSNRNHKISKYNYSFEMI